MALEFALRPRIRLSEGTAPLRRAPRWRLPKLALPIAAYWLTAGGITYALIRAHEQPGSAPEAQPVAAALVEEPAQPGWEPPTAPTSAAAVTSEPEPTSATLPSTQEPTPIAPQPTPPQPSEESPPALRAPSSAPSRASQRLARRDEDAPGSRPLAHSESELSALLAPALEREVPAPTPAPTPAIAPASDTPDISGSLPSCEAAAAAANQQLDLAHRDTSPDLSRAAIAAVLDNGVWIARCDVPMNTSIELCVAIQGGAVIGVSVSSRPASAAINACLKRRAAGLHFPLSSRVDLAKTRF